MIYVCLVPDINECDGDNKCENQNGSYSCTCKQGFVSLPDNTTSEGTNISTPSYYSYLFCNVTDIDECQTDNDMCAQQCINTPGSYM